MLRIFQKDLLDPDQFTVTLELVPGRDAGRRGIDTVMGIAKDAFADGRVSAVSITDNPGGNPALSPDVLGYEIFKIGLDVIVHFTCRDMNRVGMESRALQLAMMGMKNILALTGDFVGHGFGGQGAPVFDIDSVQLQILLEMLNERLQASGDPDEFFSGCAVSPFKRTEAESFAQYAKLCRKAAAGAQFVITQLGYDSGKFAELMEMMAYMGLNLPALGSVYVLTSKAARIMNAGKVPGAEVPNALLQQVVQEWRSPRQGRAAAIKRAAQLAAVLKGIGYKGIHIGGIHHDYNVVAQILDLLPRYAAKWRDLLPRFNFSRPEDFYAFSDQKNLPGYGHKKAWIGLREKMHYQLLSLSHSYFFEPNRFLTPVFERFSGFCDGKLGGRIIQEIVEDPTKKLLLNCQRCGDCAIEHVGFLCPESQCPKHMRNGACGGSLNGRCEVYSERYCVWVRAYKRLSDAGKKDALVKGCVAPRMWELNQSSSWLNYHLKRDHQGSSDHIANRCRTNRCKLSHNADK